MVALRLVDGNAAVDYGRAYGDTESEPRKRSAQSAAVRARKAAKARNARRWENLWLNAAIAAVAVYLTCAFANSVRHQILAASTTAFSVSPVVNVTVKPGDTLWQYAVRYGAPDRYILDRVEAIARENRLSPDASLVPGQRLQIQVANPLVIAKLERQNRVHMAYLAR